MTFWYFFFFVLENIFFLYIIIIVNSFWKNLWEDESSAWIFQLAKTKAMTHLLTCPTAFWGRHLMSHNAKAGKLKRALLQNEELCRAKTL